MNFFKELINRIWAWWRLREDEGLLIFLFNKGVAPDGWFEDVLNRRVGHKYNWPHRTIRICRSETPEISKYTFEILLKLAKQEAET